MTIAQDITKRLNGDWHGDYGTFPTPGHGPKDRGMSVKDASAPDGVLINSFNGGDPLAVKDLCREMGILPGRSSDDFRRRSPVWTVTGTYEYVDADGSVLYRTQRREKAGERKKFVAEQLRGKEWVFGIKGVPRVLYRLPEILAADPSEPIYLVEGERKADKLASWGFVATAVAFGSSGWQKGYAAPLAGRKVVILPDNDDVGREFAEKARKDIELTGASVAIIDLPGLSPKGDIMDWQGSADELRVLVDKASEPSANLLKSLDLAALANVRPVAKKFAIERIAPLAEVTLFTGPGSAGKSLLGQQLATAAAARIPCLGLAIMPSPAIYLTCEDDAEQLHFRQAHICEALGVPMSALAGKLHLISLRGELENILTVDATQGVVKPSPSYVRLAETVRATGSKLVFLDNVAHLFDGNENDRGDVTQFVNLLNRLAGECGAAIILLGHPNKSGDEWSGSTAWPNAVRSRIFLEHNEDTDLRTLSLPKANYGKKGEVVSFRWHEWAFVRDDDLPEDTRAELAAAVAIAGANAAFLACLRARNEQGDGRQVGPSSGPNYAPSQFEGMPQAKGFKKVHLKQAMDRLYSIGRIKSETVFDRKAKRDKTIIVEDVEASHNAHNARTTAAQHSPTTPHNDGTTGGQHTPIYKYIPGAASSGPAPYDEMGGLSKFGDTDLDADGDVIGWND